MIYRFVFASASLLAGLTLAGAAAAAGDSRTNGVGSMPAGYLVTIKGNIIVTPDFPGDRKSTRLNSSHVSEV
jgi:hypothetical protein